MRKCVLVLILGFFACPYIHATPLDVETGNAFVKSGQDEDGNSVQYTFSTDGLLIRSVIEGVGVSYSYSTRKMLTHGVADNGFSFEVTRDRENRIKKIAGRNSEAMTVSYVGKNVVPTKILMTISSQKYETAYTQASDSSDAPVCGSTLQRIDRRLVTLFEAYAFAAQDFDSLSGKKQ